MAATAADHHSFLMLEPSQARGKLMPHWSTMSLEFWGTIASFGTFIVIAATAIAALIQLKHMRDGNQLTGLLDVLSRVEDPLFNEYVDRAKAMLNEKLPDPNYRRSIQDSTFEREHNPWLNMANSYEWVGSLIKHRLIPEEPFMDVYSSRLIFAWRIIEPVVAIRRRNGDPSLWENFEYLVVRAHAWEAQFPNGAYPKHASRLSIPDVWLEEDKALGKTR